MTHKEQYFNSGRKINYTHTRVLNNGMMNGIF